MDDGNDGQMIEKFSGHWEPICTWQSLSMTATDQKQDQRIHRGTPLKRATFARVWGVRGLVGKLPSEANGAHTVRLWGGVGTPRICV